MSATVVCRKALLDAIKAQKRSRTARCVSDVLDAAVTQYFASRAPKARTGTRSDRPSRSFFFYESDSGGDDAAEVDDPGPVAAAAAVSTAGPAQLPLTLTVSLHVEVVAAALFALLDREAAGAQNGELPGQDQITPAYSADLSVDLTVATAVKSAQKVLQVVHHYSERPVTHLKVMWAAPLRVPHLSQQLKAIGPTRASYHPSSELSGHSGMAALKLSRFKLTGALRDHKSPRGLSPISTSAHLVPQHCHHRERAEWEVGVPPAKRQCRVQLVRRRSGSSSGSSSSSSAPKHFNEQSCWLNYIVAQIDRCASRHSNAQAGNLCVTNHIQLALQESRAVSLAWSSDHLVLHLLGKDGCCTSISLTPQALLDIWSSCCTSRSAAASTKRNFRHPNTALKLLTNVDCSLPHSERPDFNSERYFSSCCSVPGNSFAPIAPSPNQPENQRALVRCVAVHPVRLRVLDDQRLFNFSFVERHHSPNSAQSSSLDDLVFLDALFGRSRSPSVASSGASTPPEVNEPDSGDSAPRSILKRMPLCVAYHRYSRSAQSRCKRVRFEEQEEEEVIEDCGDDSQAVPVCGHEQDPSEFDFFFSDSSQCAAPVAEALMRQGEPHAVSDDSSTDSAKSDLSADSDGSWSFLTAAEEPWLLSGPDRPPQKKRRVAIVGKSESGVC